MSVIQARYRVVNFIGGRILESRELNTLQNIGQGVDATGNATSYEQTAIYRQGAMLNATVGISGSTITISPTDGVNPVLVFVRDRWEAFLNAELTSTTLTGSQVTIYLNWQLALITVAQDSTLIDGATGNPTAEMGQLNLEISAVDDSARSVASTELAKNTSPIILVQLAYNSGTGTYSNVVIDNAVGRAHATLGSSGLVTLSTATSNGEAASSDDARLSNSRTPATASVQDSSVRTPVAQSGTNSDTSPVYDLTLDPGGISAAKIILQATTQCLSDAWTLFKTAFNALLGRYNSHEGIVLGLSNTHPFPTPAQVGAVPASHIGQQLNLVTSHPATVTQSSGGFVANRVANGSGAYVSNPMDPAYGIYEGSSIVAGVNHDGDIYSRLANALSAAPGGAGGTVTYSGPLGLLSNLATVVRDHVNQTTDANPHGITLNDLGGTSIAVSTITAGAMTYMVMRFAPNGNAAIEVAIGIGVLNSGTTIPLPSGNFSYSQFLAHPSVNSANNGSLTINNLNCSIQSGNVLIVTMTDNNNHQSGNTGVGNVIAIAWRFNA